jgi:DNA-binding MarR family transcriptional regulator
MPESSALWLSDQQQHVWRLWLSVQALMPAALHRELQADAGLSLPDYDVLVQLAESPRGKARVTDLAKALAWEKSRVSHHLTRMERRGLVQREECHDDGRGAFVAITQVGRTAIERAAPGHVRTVHALLFDQLTDEELDTLDVLLGKITQRLLPQSQA